MLELFYLLVLNHTNAFGFVDEFSIKENICHSSVLSPAQIRLYEQKEIEKNPLEIQKISNEIASHLVIDSYYSGSRSALKAALASGNQDAVTHVLSTGTLNDDHLWLIGAIPDELLRRGIYETITRPKDGKYFYGYQFSNVESLKSWLKQFPQIEKEELVRAGTIFENRLSTSIPIDTGARASLKIAAFCGDYSKLNILECKNAVQKILDWMSVKVYKTGSHSGFEVSQSELLKTVVFGDLDYHRLIKWTALELMHLVEKEAIPQSRLFDVVLKTAKEIKGDLNQATEMAWNIIGLYSFYGAAIGSNLVRITPEVREMGLAFDLFSSAIQVLDSRMQPQGSLFSLPQSFRTHLDSGKPYHFWASAYLTRQLMRAGYSSFVSSLAPWLSQIGYQMLSSTKGRDPIRVFMLKKVDYSSLKIRMDLVNSAAGIRHGLDAFSGSGAKNYSIEDSFYYSFLKGEESPQFQDRKVASEFFYNGSGIKPYLRWTSIFRPKLIFRSFELMF